MLSTFTNGKFSIQNEMPNYFRIKIFKTCVVPI